MQSFVYFLKNKKEFTMTSFYDDVISLPSPKCFVKMLSYSNLSPLLGIEKQLEKLA